MHEKSDREVIGKLTELLLKADMEERRRRNEGGSMGGDSHQAPWWQDRDFVNVVADYAFGFPIFFFGMVLSVVAALVDGSQLQAQLVVVAYLMLLTGAWGIDRGKRRLKHLADWS